MIVVARRGQQPRSSGTNASYVGCWPSTYGTTTRCDHTAALTCNPRVRSAPVPAT